MKKKKLKVYQLARDKLLNRKHYLLSQLESILDLDKKSADIVRGEIMVHFWRGNLILYAYTENEREKLIPENIIELTREAVRSLLLPDGMNKLSGKKINHLAVNNIDSQNNQKTELFFEDYQEKVVYEHLCSKDWIYYEKLGEGQKNNKSDFLAASAELHKLYKRGEDPYRIQSSDIYKKYNIAENDYLHSSFCTVIEIESFAIHINDLQDVLNKNKELKELIHLLPLTKKRKDSIVERNVRINRKYQEIKSIQPKATDTKISEQIAQELEKKMNPRTVNNIISRNKRSSLFPS